MEANNLEKLNILYEDKHIIVVIKPPTIPSQSDKTGDLDMVSLIKNHLCIENPKKDPYLGIVHRLDRPVGGVMVFAKTNFANSRLNEAIRNKEFKKVYYTVVCGTPDNPINRLCDYLIKLKTVNMSKVTTTPNKNAKEAILTYETLNSITTEEFGTLSLLKVELHTGRHHQIRVQLSNAKIPIWGDNKYNKTFVKMKSWTQISLWATSLSFKHPKENKTMTFESLPKTYPFELFSNLKKD